MNADAPAAAPVPAAAVARNPLGSHVPVGRGLAAGALARMHAIGAETLQVFVGNPRGWASSTGDPRQDALFRERRAVDGTRAWVHAPYLVNLGSPTAQTYERSVATVAHTMTRAAAVGAEGVVVHTGSIVDPAADGPGAQERFGAALRRVREGLLPVLDALPDPDPATGGPWLLLEPTAGQGRSLCAGVDDLGPYLDALDRHPRVGVCLDTCHVFAAGAPLDEPGGTTATLDRLVEVAGPGRLRLVHANDSQDVRGAAKDRHERIGAGHIGTEAFVELLAHPATDGVPLVLETPGSGEGGACLDVLRAARAAAWERTGPAGRGTLLTHPTPPPGPPGGQEPR